MNVVELFDEYRFKKRNLPLIEGELSRQEKRIMVKTSKIKAEGGFSENDLGDCYNDLIERKLRLEDKLLDYQSFVSLIECALNRIKEENPIEYEAISTRHLECRTIFQIETRLNFSRVQVWRYLKKGEKLLIDLLEIVK